jgi:hypothetical protein
MIERYWKCATPDCLRKVGGGAAHCCGECAHSGKHHYEIHEHSPACDQRAAERGTWTLAEAWANVRPSFGR